MITLSFTGNNSGPPTGTKSSAEGRRIAKPPVEQPIAPLEKKRRLMKNIIGKKNTSEAYNSYHGQFYGL